MSSTVQTRCGNTRSTRQGAKEGERDPERHGRAEVGSTCLDLVGGVEMLVAPLRPRPMDSAAAWHRRPGPLQAGQVIDERYEVMEIISNGATADVCMVRHRVLGRRFALKALRTECSRDLEFTERLLREARALAAMNHPNIVSITDSGRLVTGEPYFVMEYVEGISLDRLLREGGPLDAGLALEVVAGVCDALDAAHRLGIIHRDVKPDNIYVVQRRGVSCVKVLDFGLARVVGQGRLTRPNTTHGTPEYMSPEQNMGLEIDPRTDIYSLGITLYELLCGRLPFIADSYVALAHQHMYAPLPSFRRWLTEGNPALRLEGIVRRCAEKDREHRYASVWELARAIDPFRVPDRTLRMPAPSDVSPAVSAPGPSPGPSPRRSEEVSAKELPSGAGLRYASLLQWTIVGCCLGTLMLALAYWLKMGHG
jgi:eukaryotic-like serine/threonine-protein kinase